MVLDGDGGRMKQASNTRKHLLLNNRFWYCVVGGLENGLMNGWICRWTTLNQLHNGMKNGFIRVYLIILIYLGDSIHLCGRLILCVGGRWNKSQIFMFSFISLYIWSNQILLIS